MTYKVFEQVNSPFECSAKKGARLKTVVDLAVAATTLLV